MPVVCAGRDRCGREEIWKSETFPDLARPRFWLHEFLSDGFVEDLANGERNDDAVLATEEWGLAQV